MRNALLVLLTPSMLIGCFPFAEGDTEFINETNYYVYGEPNIDKGVHIGYNDKEWGGIGLIEAPVTAMAYSNEFIFVKREFQKPEFFILKVIDTGVHSDAKRNMIGPLDSLFFAKELNKLGVDDFHWKSKFGK